MTELIILAVLFAMVGIGLFVAYRKGRAAAEGDAIKGALKDEKIADAARRDVAGLDAAERDRLLNRRD